jgi:hypothetical protein
VSSTTGKPSAAAAAAAKHGACPAVRQYSQDPFFYPFVYYFSCLRTTLYYQSNASSDLLQLLQPAEAAVLACTFCMIQVQLVSAKR